jgi:hypothetical protein
MDQFIPSLEGAVTTLAFLVGGGAFLVLWRREPDEWWPLIPGLALIALGLTRALEWLPLPRVAGALAGSLLFLGLGTAFLVVYVRDREHWWAAIPSGALFGLAGAPFFGSLGYENLAGASLFIGLSAAFLVLLVVERQLWAALPAIALGALAATVLAPQALFGRTFVGIGDWWPLALVVFGAYLLLKRE